MSTSSLPLQTPLREMSVADRKNHCGPKQFPITRVKTTPVTQEVPHSQNIPAVRPPISLPFICSREPKWAPAWPGGLKQAEGQPSREQVNMWTETLSTSCVF